LQETNKPEDRRSLATTEQVAA